jgi:hypothetical protein
MVDHDDIALYKLHMAARPDEYAAHRWVFDLLLRTFEVVDGA